MIGLPLDEPVVAARKYMRLTADDIKNAFAKKSTPATWCRWFAVRRRSKQTTMMCRSGHDPAGQPKMIENGFAPLMVCDKVDMRAFQRIC